MPDVEPARWSGIQILRIATSPISKVMTAGNLGLQVPDKDLVAEGSEMVTDILWQVIKPAGNGV